MRNYLNESTLNLLADAIAAHITIRTYVNGTSYDTTRASSDTEHAAIRSVAVGSLLGLNYGDAARSGASDSVVLNTAEFILMQSLRTANTYNTIYNPLKAILEAWRLASELTRNHLSSWSARVLWNLFPAWHDWFTALMAYEPDDAWGPIRTLQDAEETLKEWQECGLADDIPAHDAGLLFLLWNMFNADHHAEVITRSGMAQ